MQAAELPKASSIRMSASIEEIAASLVTIQSELRPVAKNGKNTMQNYTYAKFEDYVKAIQEQLKTNALCIVTTIGTPVRLEPRPTAKGTLQYAVEVSVTLRLLHKSGQWIEIDCYGEGVDPGDKAIYKAITGGRKYALACLLGLSTTDDPEEDSGASYTDNENRSQPPKKQWSKGTGSNTGSNQKNNNSSQPANGHAHNRHTGETSKPTPRDDGLSFDEAMKYLMDSKSIEEIKKAFEFAKMLKLTEGQRETLVKLKDRMKAKIA